MTPPARPFVLLLCCGLLGLACKKDADPQSVPVPSASVVAPPPSAATETAPTASASAAPTTPPPAPVVTQPPIDGCCSALNSYGNSAKSKGDKDKYLQAAKICSGIAAKVKSGASQRSSALVTIRSQLSGVNVPPDCH